MRSDATTVDDYLDSVDEKLRPLLDDIRTVIIENLPERFQETMNYGMIEYVFPTVYILMGIM